MCTIVVLNQVHPEYPVIIAANRDEFYARPSTPPKILQEEPRIVGGQDGRKLGTWMGATASGFFVGVTNQRTWAPADASRRSRGAVVLDCLRVGSVDAVDALLGSLDPAAYNPFNLVYADAGRVRVAYVREASVEFVEVPQGVHVLPNDRLDHPEWFKVGRAKDLLQGAETAPWGQLRGRLEALLDDEVQAPIGSVPEPPVGSPFTREVAHRLTALSIKTPVYGTRSATIAALHSGGVSKYLFATRGPEASGFEDVVGLLG